MATRNGMVNRSNQIGRVNERKNRDFFSNNLPFREANGLAPDLPLQFLWPTGAEAGGYWDFGNSGYQLTTNQVTATAGDFRLSAVGQTVGIQLDRKVRPVQHSLDLSSRISGYSGTSAQTIGVNENEITFTKAAAGDYIAFGAGVEFPVAEFSRVEAVLLIESPTLTVNGINFIMGNIGSLLILSPGRYIYTCQSLQIVNGQFIVQAFNAINDVKLTVLSLTGYPGSHLQQGTTTARPISAIETVGSWNQSVYSGRFDGVDDEVRTPVFVAGSLTNNMDVFMAVKKTAAAQSVLLYETSASGTKYMFLNQNGSPDPVSPPSGGAAWTCFVDGVQLGGVANTTAGELYDALTINQWHVVELRNIDMSGWIAVAAGNYTAHRHTGNIGIIAVCPAQSDANRTLARRIIGAQVGLLL
jgi:hypothetical protein